MYHMRYSDVIEESGVSARERESALFNRCIEKLEEIDKNEVNNTLIFEYSSFIEKFWLAVIEDLSREDNYLPNDLKGDIISIGIYVVKEMTNLRNGQKIDIAALIDISRFLRDGLAVN